MTPDEIHQLRKAELAAYHAYMFHEAAERGYDPEAANLAFQQFLEAGRRLREAEAAGRGR